jgi:hypothetical protein
MMGRIVKATGSVTYDTPESAAAASEAAQPAIVEDVGPGDVPADEESTPTYVQLTDPAEIAGKTVERVETCVWTRLFLRLHRRDLPRGRNRGRRVRTRQRPDFTI